MSTDHTPLLSLNSLRVTVAGKHLLENFNLNLFSGDRLAILGPSGCGKTTLLRCIAGLTSPSSGNVLLKGLTPDKYGWPSFRRRVVLVTQKPTLLDASVEINLTLPFTFNAANGAKFPSERAQQLLQNIGMGTEQWKQQATSLSIGQQQRVCIIRTLLLEPDIFLFDEPTSALDQENVHLVEELFVEETKRRPCAMMIVTHNEAQASSLCTQQIYLSSHGASSSSPGGNDAD